MKDIDNIIGESAYRVLNELLSRGNKVKSFAISDASIYGYRLELRSDVPEDEMWCEYIGADGQPHRQVVKLT